jgi:hypothetical protein
VGFLGFRDPIHNFSHSGGILGSRRVGPDSRGILDLVMETSDKETEARLGIKKSCAGPKKN